MASAVEVKIEGLTALQKRLDALPGKVQRRAIRKPLRATAKKIKERLVRGTPRRSAPMHASAVGLKHAYQTVKINVRVTQRTAYARVRYKGRAELYMRLYEFGGKRQPARSFFRGALGGFEGEASRDFIEGLKAAVEREEDAAGE